MLVVDEAVVAPVAPEAVPPEPEPVEFAVLVDPEVLAVPEPPPFPLGDAALVLVAAFVLDEREEMVVPCVEVEEATDEDVLAVADCVPMEPNDRLEVEVSRDTLVLEDPVTTPRTPVARKLGNALV